MGCLLQLIRLVDYKSTLQQLLHSSRVQAETETRWETESPREYEPCSSMCNNGENFRIHHLPDCLLEMEMSRMRSDNFVELVEKSFDLAHQRRHTLGA